ncbi:putative imidazolonepropionase [Hypsibius exemplaris]|uniref:Probable imidazolonepropionase n=1 Tax=Hypsibius exemplaris TaxID=2072580 RepID=A0A9X6RJP1_HYPEX|nr:putative imidazolonepropionase [Hypsibius exemplaris]
MTASASDEKPYNLLIHSARQVVQVVSNGARLLAGTDMGQVAVIQHRFDVGGILEGVSVVVNSDGMIAAVGYDKEISTRYPASEFKQVIDATGQCVLPGLIDGHTHPVWAGDRVHEFSMKLAGASYMDIHKAGGGIYFTVDHTRAASEEELYVSLKERLNLMLKNGTTTAEVKSGYGLDLENELKLLRVLHRAKKECPIGLSITYCGAHAVPKGMTAEVATDEIIKDHLPRIKAEIDAGSLQGRFLERGKAFGMAGNFTAEELSYLGGAEMGAEVGATGISHLEEISPEGITKMAAAGSVAVLLPTTAFLMRLTPPPVRKMISGGVAVALGSDFNPNAYCLSMPIVMHLAAVTFHMSLPETLVAATINAAASLNLAHSHGSIEVGKVADLLLITAPSWEHLTYQLGNASLIATVVKSGAVVYSENN